MDRLAEMTRDQRDGYRVGYLTSIIKAAITALEPLQQNDVRIKCVFDMLRDAYSVHEKIDALNTTPSQNQETRQ